MHEYHHVNTIIVLVHRDDVLFKDYFKNNDRDLQKKIITEKILIDGIYTN